MPRPTNDEINKMLISVIEELLDHGDFYTSAIELSIQFDGEEWEKKARQVIGKSKELVNG